MSYSAMFTRCFRALMHLEGWDEYVNHPADAGGETKYGLSKLAYPTEDIPNMTPERAMMIYHRDFWKVICGDSLNSEAIAFQLFESAVHMDPPGYPRRATKIAQIALTIHGVEILIDGVFGPKTLMALNSYRYKDSLVKWMNLIQGMFLLVGTNGEDDLLELIKPRLTQLQIFTRGWGRRIEI